MSKEEQKCYVVYITGAGEPLQVLEYPEKITGAGGIQDYVAEHTGIDKSTTSFYSHVLATNPEGAIQQAVDAGFVHRDERDDGPFPQIL